MSLETQSRIDQNRIILGGSSPLAPGEGDPFTRYLTHTRKDLEPLVSGKNVVLITYATPDLDRTTNGLSMVLRRMGARTIYSTHQYPGGETNLIQDAESIYIEGGSTGRLVANLHGLRNYDGSFVDKRLAAAKTTLVNAIRNKVSEGTPIVGFSAGLNVMGADTRTTNDMASAIQITENGLVARFDSLALFPPYLNFNPHYPPKIEKDLNEYVGENRAERIEPILEMDEGRIVLALREGAYILVDGMKMELKGTMGGALFRWDEESNMVVSEEIEAGADLSHLLKSQT